MPSCASRPPPRRSRPYRRRGRPGVRARSRLTGRRLAVGARKQALDAVLARADDVEQRFLVRPVDGRRRSGGPAGRDGRPRSPRRPTSPRPQVRRALTLNGDLAETARIALEDGSERARSGSRSRSAARCSPMLAATAPDVAGRAGRRPVRPPSSTSSTAPASRCTRTARTSRCSLARSRPSPSAFPRWWPRPARSRPAWPCSTAR